MSEDLHAKGINGRITISGDWLTITRKGLMSIGHAKGDRRIPLASLTAVQFRPSSTFRNGYVRFLVPGSTERAGGEITAASDENMVTFKRKRQAEFDAIRERVEQFITRKQAGSQPTTSEPDAADQLKKHGELRDAGVVTDEEFEAKKAELLKRL
jgi:Domain of unknown function (DUF4429)/Short C-terminal domain